MSWNQLMQEGRAELRKPDAIELKGLRAIVVRNLADAALPGLSADNRLGLAYEAGLTAATMAIRCAGYRVKGSAHHKTTFEALVLAMGSGVEDDADLFDRYRRERNVASYDAAGRVSASQAQDALREATRLIGVVESTNHPQFAG